MCTLPFSTCPSRRDGLFQTTPAPARAARPLGTGRRPPPAPPRAPRSAQCPRSSQRSSCRGRPPSPGHRWRPRSRAGRSARPRGWSRQGHRTQVAAPPLEGQPEAPGATGPLPCRPPLTSDDEEEQFFPPGGCISASLRLPPQPPDQHGAPTARKPHQTPRQAASAAAPRPRLSALRGPRSSALPTQSVAPGAGRPRAISGLLGAADRKPPLEAPDRKPPPGSPGPEAATGRPRATGSAEYRARRARPPSARLVLPLLSRTPLP